MKKESKFHLDDYLKIYEETRFDFETGINENDQRKKEFFKSYERIIMDNIIPVMREFSDYIESKGHGALIGNNFENKSVFMNIYPEKMRNYSHPSISFMAEEETQKISIHTKTFMHGNGGYKKYIGEFELKDITSDFVENKIVDLIKESFAKYGKSTNYNKLSFWK